ncbi:hypothetical protein FOXG_19614 [Fusarium oxysporum f. sp. lycopersici 4287]|uniref:Uncharacterized protein n=1 Tax=Fusarium oxysporum f. sp. lycopersici (strain 4287 / CBS 123668 / FGSC 9935 / NRRL 34936) TaxID=426428 RepID=A0A0J9V5Z8_FUSO4|nr:hypothetical protein FOXG_19614 [Fusarium oxysporum f. sp. lycopersici 4287]KNB06256.1 hypothetical protein FOXG_19614 [Fusarium oxysporum f. sp. lycopersici 4287]
MESTTQVGRNKMLVEKPMGGANPLTACIEPILGEDNAVINAPSYPDLYTIEP